MAKQPPVMIFSNNFVLKNGRNTFPDSWCLSATIMSLSPKHQKDTRLWKDILMLTNKEGVVFRTELRKHKCSHGDVVLKHGEVHFYFLAALASNFTTKSLGQQSIFGSVCVCVCDGNGKESEFMRIQTDKQGYSTNFHLVASLPEIYFSKLFHPVTLRSAMLL